MKTEWRRAQKARIGMALTALVFSAMVAAQPQLTPAEVMECGPWKNASTPPPKDYRTAPKSYIAMVEDHHFTELVEQLIKPMFVHLGSDISYTLHALPNHPRALVSLMRLSGKERTATPAGAGYSVDCYFRRALRYAPDDLMPRMLYVQYLHQQKRSDDALRQLDFVASQAGDQPFTHYNAGLLYAELGEFDKALKHAHLASQLGMPRTQLKDKLVAAGRWREPSPAPGLASEPSPAASR